jgi:protein-arginine kinase
VSGTPQETGGTATARPVEIQGGGTSGRRLEARIDRATERGFVIGIHGEGDEFVAAVAVYRPSRVAVVATSDMELWQRLRPVAEKYEKDERMADEDLLQAVREAVNT